MTDTNPLPPLPEPEGVIVVGTQALRAFTAYQMRTYALQAIALRPVQVPMTGWQPIETAPNTGPFLAVLDCGGDQTICTMRHGVIASKNSRPDGDFIRERVTHWMPLPPLPKSTQTGITAQAKKEDK